MVFMVSFILCDSRLNYARGFYGFFYIETQVNNISQKNYLTGCFLPPTLAVQGITSFQ